METREPTQEEISSAIRHVKSRNPRNGDYIFTMATPHADLSGDHHPLAPAEYKFQFVWLDGQLRNGGNVYWSDGKDYTWYYDSKLKSRQSFKDVMKDAKTIKL